MRRAPSQNEVHAKLTMVKVEDEPRASVEGGCGNTLGCGVVDGDGGEEHQRVEISGDAAEHGAIAGSVAGEDGFPDEKQVHEARYELYLKKIC